MRRLSTFIIVAVIGLCSCGQNQSKTPVYYKFTDDLGRVVNLKETPKRIISLAPSITEIIYFIEAENKLVARTQACDFPSRVKKLPIVSTYPLDIESIVKQNPDLVISVDGIINPDQVNKLEELGISVFFQKYESIADIDSSIINLGEILGVKQTAVQKVDSLRKQLSEVRVNAQNPFKCLMVTWNKPIFVYGFDTPFTDKVKLAGGENAMSEVLNSPYPEISREYVLKMNPDVILGNNFEKMDTSFFALYPELKAISAYKKKQIFDVDDNLMSRPSPRYVESVVELKNILSSCEK